MLKKRKINKIGAGLKSINQTPVELYKMYYSKWENFKKPNVIIVNYDDCIKNLNKFMNKLADFLGEEKREWKNVDEKVGWIPQ